MNYMDYQYIPLLSVRRAEMQALEETKASAKDVMLPFIVLQPWATAKSFDSTLVRVQNAFSDRPIIVDLTDQVFVGPTRRPVHDAIEALRDHSHGYRNWYDLVEKNDNFIPTLQMADPASIPMQIVRASAIDRGLVIRLTESMIISTNDIVALLAAFPDHSKLLFIIDLERQTRDLLTKAATISAPLQIIRSAFPGAVITVCASTFPESFTTIDRQDIFERSFFDIIQPIVGADKTIYCDRGSVRAERRSGGGGAPAPRIDNALTRRWRFYREADEEDRDLAYQLAATAAIDCSDWTDLGIWGTNQIKITSDGAAGAIDNAGASTSARINIHLHVQAVGASPVSSEEEWVD